MVGDRAMKIVGFGVSLMAVMTACAVERYPLLEEDGRYRTAPPTEVASAENATPVGASHAQAPTSVAETAVSEQDTADPIEPRPDGFKPVEGTITPPRIEGEAAPRSSQAVPVDLVAGDTVPIPQASGPQAPSSMPKASMATAASVEEALRVAAEQALATVNALRAEKGEAALALSMQLNEIAKAHVVDLAAWGEVTSLNQSGEGVGVRLKKADYLPKVAGSLVAGGYSDFDAALAEWQTSEVEMSRLLMPQAEEMGFAIISDRLSRYGTYIEVIIAAPEGD